MALELLALVKFPGVEAEVKKFYMREHVLISLFKICSFSVIKMVTTGKTSVLEYSRSEFDEYFAWERGVYIDAGFVFFPFFRKCLNLTRRLTRYSTQTGQSNMVAKPSKYNPIHAHGSNQFKTHSLEIGFGFRKSSC